MKYKCLVLDHDDTVVASTASIHYPCFIEYLKITRPHLVSRYTVEDYFVKNFDPGIVELLMDEVGLDTEELKVEEKFWEDYVKDHTPTAYPGIRELISEFRRRGGLVAVNSHSLTKYIIRDYEFNSLPMPDIIYGWDIPKTKRKPKPDTLFELMGKFGLKKEEIIVVDDLKPGYDMARAAGVDFAAAGWAYDVPEIEEFMKKNCDYYFKTVNELFGMLFE